MSAAKELDKLKRDNKIKMYKECFDVFDVDRSGEISVEEHFRRMTELGQNIEKEEFMDLVRSTDPDGKTELHIAEYLISMAKRKPGKETNEEKKSAAKIFDVGNYEHISKQDLEETMRICNLELTEEELNDIFKENDKDNNGFLGMDEFIKMMDTAENLIRQEGFESNS